MIQDTFKMQESRKRYETYVKASEEKVNDQRSENKRKTWDKQVNFIDYVIYFDQKIGFEDKIF